MLDLTNDEDVPLPRDSYKLVELLDQLYPPRCILPSESPESAHRYAGVRDLVDVLVEWKREEETKAKDEAADSTDGYSIIKQDGVRR